MKTITIMPDFGNGPYGWIKCADDESCAVGGNFVDAVCGFEGSEYTVSADLERDFAAWVWWFEIGCRHRDDRAAFDWPEFHRQGLTLTIRLKAEIGDQARVMYDKPFELTQRSELRSWQMARCRRFTFRRDQGGKAGDRGRIARACPSRGPQQ